VTKTQQPPTTDVILAIRKDGREDDRRFAERIEELANLCDAAGAKVVGQFVQERSDIDSSTYLGSGKVLEIADEVEALGISLVVFDQPLSPAQIRNLEDRLGCRVIDRNQLILDIFSLRARSKEGRLQVEIAQLQYMLPRLTGRGVEMSRLGAGIGTRGPGETKLEVDRRRIRHRISYLRKDLTQVRRAREIQRAKRQTSVPVVALVGYTNAGKTTLLQRWTARKGTVQGTAGHNRLFDTLDPMARRVKAGKSDMVLLDTVGFVQDLPHLLVDAFRATLEEVLAADVILHVVDATSDVEKHLQTTYDVLTQLGAMDKPIVTFFNKMDLVQIEPGPDARASQTVYGSAQSGGDIDLLIEVVERAVGLDAVRVTVDGHGASKQFWSDVARAGRVIETEEKDNGELRLTLEVDRRNASTLMERVAREDDIHVETNADF